MSFHFKLENEIFLHFIFIRSFQNRHKNQAMVNVLREERVRKSLQNKPVLH